LPLAAMAGLGLYAHDRGRTGNQGRATTRPPPRSDAPCAPPPRSNAELQAARSPYSRACPPDRPRRSTPATLVRYRESMRRVPSKTRPDWVTNLRWRIRRGANSANPRRASQAEPLCRWWSTFPACRPRVRSRAPVIGASLRADLGRRACRSRCAVPVVARRLKGALTVLHAARDEAPNAFRRQCSSASACRATRVVSRCSMPARCAWRARACTPNS
jgi:hypothetical protein